MRWSPCERHFVRGACAPCFEFIEEYAPDLGPALVAVGFDLEERYPLLVCTPETLRPGPPIPGLTITTLTPDSPAEDFLACLTVQRQGFGEIAGDPRPWTMSMKCGRIWPRMALSWREWMASLRGR